MIQVNELRIGNWLERLHGDYFQVGYSTFQEFYIYPEYFLPKPIPLTEDWLIKLGFKQWVNFGRKTYNYDLMPLCNFSYCFVTKKVMILENGNSMSHWIERKIEYVHELQNLYFALRGKELTPLH